MSVGTLKTVRADRLWRRIQDALPPRVVFALLVLVGVFIPASLLLLPMPWIVGAVAAMLGVMLVVAFPYLGLLMFLGLLYLRPEEAFPQLTGLRLTLLISLVAFFAWLINTCLCRERFRLHLPAVQSILGFVVIGMASTLVSGSGELAEQSIDLLRLFLLFVLVVHLVNTEGRLRLALGVLVTFSVFLGARTIWQYHNGQALVQSDGTVRALSTGIFGDPNDLALAMAMAVPLALGAGLGSRGPGAREAGGAGSWAARLWNLAAVPVLIWTIFVTNSRGGMLALGAAIFCFFIRRVGRVGLVLGALVVVGIFAFGPSRLSNMSANEESAQGRVVAWRAGLQMLKRSPFYGVGKGQFVEYHKLTAHNSLMLCLAELGLTGTAFWLGLFYFVFRDGRLLATGRKPVPAGASPRNKGTPPTRRRSQSAVIQVSLITFVIGGFFLSRTYTPPLYVYLSLAVAALCLEAQEEGITLPGVRGCDWAWIGALTMGGVVLMMLLVRLWH
jgi:putative inorganic carbon (HCO3(-)) transporter